MDNHDFYMQDFGEEAEQLAFAFVEFWQAYARLLQASGMAITAYFGVAEDRRQVFNEAMLEPSSLSTLASVLRTAMAHLELEGSRELPKKLQEIAARRNRFAHDALTFDLDGTWPELRTRAAFKATDSKAVTASELRSVAATCTELEDRLLGLLPALEVKKPDSSAS